MIEILVPGTPRPQKRPRLGRGRVYDPSKDDKKAFILQSLQFRPDKPLEGPLNVKLHYYFRRPKSHHRSGKYAGIVKESAPLMMGIKPDIDNLIKLTLDALNGTFWIDDAQIAQISAVKVYSPNPRTHVQLEEINHE